MSLALMRLLHFYINFRINLSISTKKVCFLKNSDCIESRINLGKHDILTMLSLLIHEHGISLDLFGSFISFSNVS